MRSIVFAAVIVFFAAQIAPTALALEATVDLDYHYLSPKPVYVNGQPVPSRGFISCLRSVTLNFSEPVNLMSLNGAVTVKGRYSSERPLTLTRYESDGLQVVYRPASPHHACDGNLGRDQLILSTHIKSTDGDRFNAEVIRLAFSPPVDHRQDLPGPVSSRYETLVDVSGTINGQRQCAESVGSQCLSQLTPDKNLTVEKVSNALVQIKNWEMREKQSPIYRTERLQKLPTEGTIMVPRGNTNASRHYGYPDTILVLRKAVQFVSLLFPDLEEVGIADMTTPDGQTPHTTWPDGSVQYLHPYGSHQGEDVDIGYISVGAGNERDLPIDLEKNFWLLHSILQSNGVDIVYTAYKRQLVRYAKAAYAKQLISEMALRRFESARVIEDDNLRHDTHMHIKVAYRDYQGHSLRFQQSDDAYNCLLGLRSQARSQTNFCLE